MTSLSFYRNRDPDDITPEHLVVLNLEGRIVEGKHGSSAYYGQR